MEQELKTLIQKLPPEILEHIGSEVFKVQLHTLCKKYEIDEEDVKEVEDTLYGFFIGMYNPGELEYLLQTASLLDEETNRSFAEDIYGVLIEPVEDALYEYWDREVFSLFALTEEEEQELEWLEKELDEREEAEPRSASLAFPSRARAASRSTSSDPYREEPGVVVTPRTEARDRLQKAVFKEKKKKDISESELLAARKALMGPYREKID